MRHLDMQAIDRIIASTEYTPEEKLKRVSSLVTKTTKRGYQLGDKDANGRYIVFLTDDPDEAARLVSAQDQL